MHGIPHRFGGDHNESDNGMVGTVIVGRILMYDEPGIKARLARLDRSGRTAFAAACAQRLFPLFERYAQSAGRNNAEVLGSILRRVWWAAEGEDVGDLRAVERQANSLVPSDTTGGFLEAGYAQNAAAAVAYAVRAYLSDDAQEGAWAARQVYEAADYAAQHTPPEIDMNAPNAERQVLERQLVQTALAAIEADLVTVETAPGRAWARLREEARDGGAVWARMLP